MLTQKLKKIIYYKNMFELTKCGKIIKYSISRLHKIKLVHLNFLKIFFFNLKQKNV